MKTEVSTAVKFLIRLFRSGLLSDEQLQHFSHCLEEILGDHYKHHWFPETPCRGSGYRCIRVNCRMDPLLWKAGCATGLSPQQLFSLLPMDLTMWIDPHEVSYRIGENGSICVLYQSTQDQPKPAETFNVMSVSS